MRIIPVSCLKPGMIVGKDLYNNHNSLLLSKGHVLSEQEIKRIANFKYRAIYITDNDFDHVEIPDNIEDVSGSLRNNAVSAAKELFLWVNTKKTLNKRVISNASHAVDDIVNEIVMNHNVTYTMTDLKLFDDYTYYHSVNVTIIAVILGYAMRLSRMNLYKLGLGALMHDIGKLFVPKDLLEKQGRLTPEEYALIKSHSARGYEYLKDIQDVPGESNLAVLAHHEQYGGYGYPQGTKGNDIPLFGRILMVADVFDALISDRPYRKALFPSEAVEYIVGGSGELFDPKIVNVFMEKISPYPVGTYVMLSNGQKAVVVENRPKFGLRPKVKVIDNTGKSIYYDLSKEFFDITITSVTYF